MPLEFLEELIRRFDGNRVPIELAAMRLEIFQAAESAKLSKTEWEVLRGEVAPLAFHTHGPEKSPWGTYFALWHSWADEGGNLHHDPDISALTAETIRRWKWRADTLSNPLLRSRYADAVWDLQPKIAPTEGSSFPYAQIAIDAYREAVRRDQYRYEVLKSFALRRALTISVQLGNRPDRAQLIDEIIEYSHAADLKKPGIWATAFDSTFEDRLANSEQSEKIIAFLEGKLQEAVETTDGFNALHAGERLIRAYHRKGDRESAIRVARLIGNTFKSMADGESPSLAVAWLQPIIDLYQREHMAKDAELLRVYVERRAKEVSTEMRTISGTVPFDAAEVEDYLERVLDVKHPIPAMIRLANSCLIDPDSIKQTMKESQEIYISQRLFPTSIIGGHGLPIAHVGTSDEDEEGLVILSVARSLQLIPLFFTPGYSKIKEKFGIDAKGIVSILFESPVFHSCEREFFDAGFEAFEQGDYLKAVYVLLFQFEGLMRGVLELFEIPTTKYTQALAELKNIDDVLSDERIKEAIEDRWRMFFRALYTDKRGYNLRNEIAHGAAPISAFNELTATLIVVSIFLLAGIRYDAIHLAREAPANSGDA